MFKKRFTPIFILILLVCTALIASGCSHQTKHRLMQNQFDNFMNDIFVQEVQSDTLSLNYSLAHPENYGIKENKSTFGEYSLSQMKEDWKNSEAELKKLKNYDYNKLSSKQKLTYEIVKSYLQQQIKFKKYPYYSECLGPTTGVQAQLPILLAEFSFHDKQDIEEYLRLLPCVREYFNEIIQYEQEKSEAGLFMSDRVANRIIEQCNAFIENPNENFLIDYFNQKVSHFKGLSKAEIERYKNKNLEAVLCYVIPAYQDLIEALKGLLGTGKNDAGLYFYDNGKDYYECLAQSKVGTAQSIDQMAELLNNGINNNLNKLNNLTDSDPSIINKYLDFSSFPLTNPKDILKDLQKDITKDFPDAVPVKCQIKYVPDSLSKFLSPAMYLVPPIDSFKDNNIYINGNNKKTLSMIYTTVAHEGYPGHLYQCVYFRNQKPAPVRNVLDFTGYDEGWATYVEFYSYHMAGIDDKLADFLEYNNIIILCMYARADIGIHYQGWDKEQVVQYITQYIDDTEVAGKIYNTLLEEPGIYLPYAVGYLQIEGLRTDAEKALGKKFVAKDFHQFLLDIGPSQFEIIKKHMDIWIKKEQNN